MKKRLGFSVVEVIIAIAVISIISATLLPTIGWLVTKSHANKTNQLAGNLLMEGVEIAYNVLQSNWDVTPGIYHPAVGVDISGRPIWELVSGTEVGLEAKFGRSIRVSDVCRDTGTGAELPCGSSSEIDLFSKRVTTEISWLESGVEKKLETSLLVTSLSQ